MDSSISNNSSSNCLGFVLPVQYIRVKLGLKSCKVHLNVF